ncbi:T-lymphocyte activation antigen CD80 isoform X2 [Lemur catta]|uniref:T-lymphocyte activation antigen CD80 isoform X2 n=1 Tax=Lemur catta TaxID=9447 RepID=UPI001E26B4EC|nr:T-lymphocyte activation antigen CD80 isoform X2 [Lemur catta]
MDYTQVCKCLYLNFLVLSGVCYSCSGVSQVIKAVKEMAIMSCDYNISAKELARVRIYWQKENDMVLSVTPGSTEVWPKYKNRTVIDITNNLSIMILDLRLSDMGKYTCVVQKLEKGSYKREHLTSVTLSIRAYFPKPSITASETPSSNIRRITCSTSGGFPEPHLSWLENEKELNAINTTVSQDPETKLYTVSSELDFNVTSNHSFVCLIKYGDLTVSQTYSWQTAKQEDFPDNPPSFQTSTILLATGISTAVIIAAVAVIIAVICYRFAQRRRKRRNEEGLEMERMSPIFIGSAEASAEQIV